ncbi:hypothetical protein [Halarchaeum nitratireducens]|uniref:Uncharacterized protein n=1 Tax=Halarchaeum nitratireducens TaxID=489913 RepID=A0A830GG30_9EURY|nr:hypothetical protein [Halarchaeum nitratireducens]GGN26959.1 hypothetical protein GCM10009021_31830 [Halarchaeum nitratireducens]
MSRFNRTPSREYSEFVDAVAEYAAGEHEPGEDVYRAVADALAEELRERFRQGWGLDEEAETPCLRRVITGADECTCSSTRSWADRERETIGARDDPPHAAPHSDHAELWLDDGEPVLYAMHPSGLSVSSVSKTAVGEDGKQIRNGWFDVLEFAQAWGLEFAVMPVSHYHAFSRTCVVFYAPEWASHR